MTRDEAAKDFSKNFKWSGIVNRLRTPFHAKVIAFRAGQADEQVRSRLLLEALKTIQAFQAESQSSEIARQVLEAYGKIT